MTTTKRILYVLTAVALLAVPSSSKAQEEADAAPYLIVHYDEIEPSMSGEFEANSRQWVEACTAAEIGEEWEWWAYSNNEFAYAWVSPLPNFAFLDGQEAREEAFAEALGEETMKELTAGNEAIRSHHTEVLKVMPELSYHPAGFDPAKAGFVGLGLHDVKPAKDEAFQELVKRVVAAFRKAEAPLAFTGYRVSFGDGSYAFASFAESAAQLYAAPGTAEVLAKAEGQEASQQIFEEWSDYIAGYETAHWQFRPELSFIPGMAHEGSGE